MRNNSQASPDDIDPIEIVAAIKRNLVKLLVLSLLVGLVTFIALSQMKPKFKSVAQLQFGGRAVVNPVGSDRPVPGGQPDVLVRVDKAAVASQVAVIKSRDLAVRLIKELGLDKRAEFNPTLGGGGLLGALGLATQDSGESAMDRVLLNYDKALKVFNGRDTRVVSIQFSSYDAKLAAQAANRLAELYLASRAKQSVKQSVDESAYLKPEIAKLQWDVQRAEAAAEQFRSAKNLFASGNGGVGADGQRGTLNNAQLSDLTRELTRAQTQKSEADARAAAIRELMRRGSADASPDVIRSPLIQRLQAQRVRVERQVSELSATLLPAHPRMRQMRADLNGLNRQIRSEVRKIVDSLGKEAKVAGLRVQSITASINKLKSQVRDSSGDLAKLAELERVAKAKRQQLESMQARYQTALARQRAAAIPLEAELFSKARASTIPMVKKGPITALATAGTFILGLAFVITKELLTGARGGRPAGGGAPGRGRRSTDRQNGRDDYAPNDGLAAQGQAAQQSMAATAALAGSEASAHDPYGAGQLQAGAGQGNIGLNPAASGMGAPGVHALPQVESMERFAKFTSMDSVAAHVAAQHGGGGGHRSLVAPAAPGYDASSEAIALATKLAASGERVILVDWSPRTDGLARKLNVGTRPGITELLRGDATFEDVIRKLAGREVHFIAGGVNLDTHELNFDENHLNLVLDALDEAYSHIVVHGSHQDATQLFELIQGRFDSALTVAPHSDNLALTRDEAGTFLGFEVADLDIIRFERDADTALAVSPGLGGEELTADARF